MYGSVADICSTLVMHGNTLGISASVSTGLTSVFVSTPSKFLVRLLHVNFTFHQLLNLRHVFSQLSTLPPSSLKISLLPILFLPYLLPPSPTPLSHSRKHSNPTSTRFSIYKFPMPRSLPLRPPLESPCLRLLMRMHQYFGEVPDAS